MATSTRVQPDFVLPFPRRSVEDALRPYSCHNCDALIPARDRLPEPDPPLDPLGGFITARGGCHSRDDQRWLCSAQRDDFVDGPATLSCALFVHDLKRPSNVPESTPPPTFLFQLRGGAGCSTEPVMTVGWTPDGWGTDASGLLMRWKGCACSQWELWGGILESDGPPVDYGKEIRVVLHEFYEVISMGDAGGIGGRFTIVLGAIGNSNDFK